MASAKIIKWYRVINSIINWLADIAIIQGDLEEALEQFGSLAMDKKAQEMKNEAEEMEKLIKELEEELQKRTSL